MKKIEMLGMKFGKLLVIGEVPDRYISKNGKEAVWVCRCECGRVIQVRGGQLRSGHTKSCGCAKGEYCGKVHLVHGEHSTRLHSIWNSMKQRCNNPNNPKYMDYGGRGITVCDEWNESFIAFRNWALANGYVDGKGHDCSIDRINNDGGYYPENCRWTTAKVQANNQRPKRGTSHV